MRSTIVLVSALFPLSLLLLGAAGCPERDAPPANPASAPQDTEERQELVQPQTLDAELFGRIAAGEPPLSSFLDPAVGLLNVEYFDDASGEDPRAGEDGLVKVAERLCGQDARARAEHLERDLKLRSEQSSHDPTFTCEDLACSHPAEMEYDSSGTYRFGRRPDGQLRLESVVRIEGAAVTEAFRQRAESWARQQRARLEGGDCR